MGKTTQHPRAKASGFAKKLRAYLHAQQEAWRATRSPTGPRNGKQLSEWLTAHGEHANPNTVRYWMSGRTLPESRHIPLLEALLGAPWSYLDDARAPWPRPLDPKAVSDLVALLPDDAVQLLIQHARALLNAPRPPRAR